MADDHRDIIISMDAAERLLRSRDAKAALYYLHLLAGGGAGVESTAAALGWSEAETLAAQASLAAAGILPTPNIEDQANSKPTYSANDITSHLEGDPAFAALITYVQTRLARTLSTSDISKLLGIYDHLGMPAGELMLLVSYCAGRERERKGEAARLGMWTVEREAYKWMGDGIDTEEKAENYLRALEERSAAVKRLARLVGIRGREVTPGEQRYLESWAASGLSDETIYAAYDRTVVATGSLKWPYMDKIIADWKQNGVPDPSAKPTPSPSANRKPTTAPKAPAQRISAAERLRRKRSQETEKEDEAK